MVLTAFFLVMTAGTTAFFTALRSRKTRLALTALLLLSLALKLISASHPYLSHWDERYHALVAKNLIAHPLEPTLYPPGLFAVDRSDWQRTDIWLHKPPLTLWELAASMALFGVNVFALRLPSLLLSTAAIALTFWIGKTLYSPRVGLIAAWLHAVTGVLVAQAAGRFSTDHVDTLFFFLVELGIALGLWHSRKPGWGRALAVGLVVGLALLTKWYPALLIVAVWALFLRRDQWKRALPHLALALLLAAAMFLSWRGYTRAQWPAIARAEETYNARHFFEVLEGHHGPWYSHLGNIGNFFSPIAYIPLVAFAIGLFRKSRIPHSAPLAAWFLLPYLFYSLAATKMGGYVLPAAPALFIISGVFWWWLYDRPAVGAWRTLKIVTLFLLLALPVLPLIHRVRPEEERPERDAYTAQLKALPQRLGPAPAALFNDPAFIETMFFTPYLAFDRLPTPDDIARAHAAGFRVVLFDDGRPLPPNTPAADVTLPMPPAPGN